MGSSNYDQRCTECGALIFSGTDHFEGPTCSRDCQAKRNERVSKMFYKVPGALCKANYDKKCKQCGALLAKELPHWEVYEGAFCSEVCYLKAKGKLSADGTPVGGDSGSAPVADGPLQKFAESLNEKFHAKMEKLQGSLQNSGKNLQSSMKNKSDGAQENFQKAVNDKARKFFGKFGINIPEDNQEQQTTGDVLKNQMGAMGDIFKKSFGKKK